MSDNDFTNALINEKSPYLLQHAHNPVDWSPWGDEAFQRARERKVPVLVSIGYATCHWCHVMERESFEDPQLAELLNANFVAIKVDREERPDVDSIYMQAVQALGQQGGWPLNVFVTPEGVPFYGGTYFPPQARHGLPSFADVLNSLSAIWKNEPDKIQQQTQSLIQYLKQSSNRDKVGSVDTLSFEGEERAAKLYREHYDSLNYGFKFQAQNKFPPSMGLSLLLRHYHRVGDVNSLVMCENTLMAMKHGGIYDQIGGGLSRYSTDFRWLVPHFEKMLYDNALFAKALIETYQVTGKREFADYANDVFQYIDRDMTSPEGGFYSAEDADSEGVEGKFYVWTKKEIEEVLDRKTASVAIPFYQVSEAGNWEGSNILNTPQRVGDVAKDMGMNEAAALESIAKARQTLLEVRSKRIRPLLDDKSLTSWNGMMISAMACAGRALEDEDRIARAAKAAEFVFSKLRAPDGKLLRRYRDGEARYDGYLFDYTSMAVACLDLYEATYESRYVARALELMETVEEKFATGKGAYYETAVDGEELIVRQVSGYDGVEPSGNSNAAMAWLRLSALRAEPEYVERSEKIFIGFHDEVMDYGINSSAMMQAFHLYLGGLKEVAIVGLRGDESTETMLKTVRRGFFPNAVFAFAYEDEVDAVSKAVPLLAGRKAVDGKATAYVCKLGTCLLPTTSPEDLENLLDYE